MVTKGSKSIQRLIWHINLYTKLHQIFSVVVRQDSSHSKGGYQSLLIKTTLAPRLALSDKFWSLWLGAQMPRFLLVNFQQSMIHALNSFTYWNVENGKKMTKNSNVTWTFIRDIKQNDYNKLYIGFEKSLEFLSSFCLYQGAQICRFFVHVYFLKKAPKSLCHSLIQKRYAVGYYKLILYQ